MLHLDSNTLLCEALSSYSEIIVSGESLVVPVGTVPPGIPSSASKYGASGVVVGTVTEPENISLTLSIREFQLVFMSLYTLSVSSGRATGRDEERVEMFENTVNAQMINMIPVTTKAILIEIFFLSDSDFVRSFSMYEMRDMNPMP